MNHLNVSTNGKPITVTYSRVTHHHGLNAQMGNLHLKIGDISVDIVFDRCSEMIRFCEEHNFTYKDIRTGVQKYLDDLDDIKNADDKTRCIAPYAKA